MEDSTSFSKTAINMKSAVSLLCSLSCAVLSAFAAQFMSLSSKSGVPGLQLVFFAKLVQFLCVLVVLPYFRPTLIPKDKVQTMFLSLSAVTDNLGTVLAFMSFVFVVPGIAFGIIQGSEPLFTACIGLLFLKETVGVVDGCGILCSAAGVVLVAVGMSNDAASSSQRLTVAILLPLAAAFIRSPNNVITRLLVGVQRVHILVITFYTQLVGTTMLLALTYIFETPRWTISAQTTGYVIGLSLCDALSAFPEKIVMQSETAGVTSTLLTLIVPLTVLLDYFFQSQFPGPMELGGITLVVLGTAVVGGHAWWMHRQEMGHKNVLKRLNFTN
ncbi:SLC35G2 [Branchiostoma lanceolatum]|uniref:SLC35G2 protein n=1 Tax=Branchiostoma lanceolatum TaxID=7740 RepID=A0A8K0AD40_BRALA|nr:SLC35G2 [Branchiostoma lanceolatum]